MTSQSCLNGSTKRMEWNRDTSSNNLYLLSWQSLFSTLVLYITSLCYDIKILCRKTMANRASFFVQWGQMRELHQPKIAQTTFFFFSLIGPIDVWLKIATGWERVTTRMEFTD